MHVTHIAWLGQRNYGDDVMAQAVRQWLASQRPATRYSVWCEGPPDTDDRVQWIYPSELVSRAEKERCEQQTLATTDLLLIGGGSILHSQNSIAWKQRAVDVLRQLNPAAQAVGINLSLGPFKDDAAEQGCIRLLRSLDCASFRDMASFAFAMQQPDLPYRPILAFDLAASYVERCGLAPREMNDAVRIVGVSIRAPEDSRDEIFAKYARLLGVLASRYESVRVFAFCTGAHANDSDFITALVNETRAENVAAVLYTGDPLAFTAQLRLCDFLIAERLHALVMGFVLNVPVLCVSYHKKCEDFAQYVGLPASAVHRRATFSPDDVLRGVRPYRLPDQRPFVELSKKNFDVFQDVLSSFESAT